MVFQILSFVLGFQVLLISDVVCAGGGKGVSSQLQRRTDDARTRGWSVGPLEVREKISLSIVRPTGVAGEPSQRPLPHGSLLVRPSAPAGDPSNRPTVLDAAAINEQRVIEDRQALAKWNQISRGWSDLYLQTCAYLARYQQHQQQWLFPEYPDDAISSEGDSEVWGRYQYNPYSSAIEYMPELGADVPEHYVFSYYACVLRHKISLTREDYDKLQAEKQGSVSFVTVKGVQVPAYQIRLLREVSFANSQKNE